MGLKVAGIMRSKVVEIIAYLLHTYRNQCGFGIFCNCMRGNFQANSRVKRISLGTRPSNAYKFRRHLLLCSRICCRGEIDALGLDWIDCFCGQSDGNFSQVDCEERRHLLSSWTYMERRKGKNNPVIKKPVVELEGAPFKKFKSVRDARALEVSKVSPWPIQFAGPTAHDTKFTLKLELGAPVIVISSILV